MSDVAPEAHSLEFGIDGDQLPGRVMAAKQLDPLEHAGAGGEFEDHPIVVPEHQVHPRVRQCQPRELLADVAKLGRSLAEVFPPDWQIAEQVANLDGGAHGAATFDHRPHHSGVDFQLVPVRELGPAGAETKAADLGDRRQRLPPEAHGLHAEEVVGFAQLAGCVAGHRQQQVVGMDPLPVVDNPDQLGSAGDDVDFHPGGQGVDAVFEQFLDRARRTFDHLARGDLVDDVMIELLNPCHSANQESDPENLSPNHSADLSATGHPD